MKISKIDPIGLDGIPKKNHEDITINDSNDGTDILNALDILLKPHNLEIEDFPESSLNAYIFRIIKRRN
jgi:hypothetical protein